MRLLKVPYWYLLAVPVMLFVSGFFMNKIAMASNGGAMPVLIYKCSADDMEGDRRHICMTHDTHVKILCDWINVQGGIESLGDILLDGSEYTFWPFVFGWLVLIIKRFSTA
jgi:hypothetical protein